jgi:hypothetical protein
MGIGAPEPGGVKRCLNCDAPLTGPYCAQCGQQGRSENPTFREFADEWSTEFFNWDGKLPATLKALLLHPGKLTQDFLAGRRARWLSPLRLYLICSVAYFVSGPLVERVTGYKQKIVAQVTITGDSTDRALIGDSLTFVSDPGIQANPVFQAIGVGRMWYLANHPSVWQDAYAEAIPKTMFVLLPYFALLTMMAWRSSCMRYPAHLAFALHVHSAFMASLIVPTLIEPIGVVALSVAASIAVLIYTTWYTYAAFQRALGGTGGQVVWRSTIVGLLYIPPALFVALVATVIAVRA